MSNGKFRFSANGILLVRSLPQEEDGLARRLAEDLRMVSVVHDSFPVENRSIESFTDLQILFSELGRRAERDGFRPILHVDAHGSREGLQFSDGSVASWERMVEQFTRLNRVFRMNLVLSLGVCEGAWAIMGLKGLERAPFALLLAPRVRVKSRDAEAWARSVFTAVLRNRSLVGALRTANALVEELSQFDPVTFKELFDLGLEGYVQDHADRAALRARAARMVRALRRSGRLLPGHPMSNATQLLRERPEHAEQMWRRYSWHDLGQDVSERTPYVRSAVLDGVNRRRPNGKARRRILRRDRKEDAIYGRLVKHYQELVDSSEANARSEW